MEEKSSRHVVPNPNGGWDVRRPGAVRSSGHAKTKQGAILRAREILANAGGGELVIHTRDGRIQDASTISQRGGPRGGQYRWGGGEESQWQGAEAGPSRVASAALDAPQVSDAVLVDGVLIRGLSEEDAVAAVRLLRAAREQQFQNGAKAARGLLHTMVQAGIELIPPASVEQARRLAGARSALLATPVYTYETLREVRGDANAATTRTWVSRSRERGRLFTVKVDGRSVIPALQLTDAGAPRAEYAATLAPLLEAELDGWTIWIWLTSPTPLLSGGIPADLIVEAGDRVQRAAQRFAAAPRYAA